MKGEHRVNNAAPPYAAECALLNPLRDFGRLGCMRAGALWLKIAS